MLEILLCQRKSGSILNRTVIVAPRKKESKQILPVKKYEYLLMHVLDVTGWKYPTIDLFCMRRRFGFGVWKLFQEIDGIRDSW